MKSKHKLFFLLLLFANVGFAKQSKQVSSTQINEKTSQTSVTKKAVPENVAVTVPEGKKGLNAVNVRTAKQTESSVKGRSTSPPASGSTLNTGQDKHAINTKGTGATRDGSGKDK